MAVPQPVDVPVPALRDFRLRKRDNFQDDAKVIGELASSSRLRVMNRYLRSTDSDSTRPGHVFVMPWEEGKRCTDGLRGGKAPSSSKRDGYLTYGIPNPPNCDVADATGRVPWLKKRAKVTVDKGLGMVDIWEIVAYDFEKPRQGEEDHGQHFRTLAEPIDDLLLTAPANDTATADAELFGRANSNDHAQPVPVPSSSLSTSSAPLPASLHTGRSLSQSLSPVMSKQEQMLFPRAPSVHPDTRASSPRYHPYIARRDPYDHYLLSRLHSRLPSRSWVSRHHR